MRALAILGALALAMGCSTGSGTGGTTGGNGGTGGGSGGSFTQVNNCQQSAYVDQTASATPTVNYGVNQQLVYQPQCTIIKAGASLSFTGDGFNIHPLTPGAAPSVGGNAGSTPNPIVAQSTGKSASFTFATPGFYPYYCAAHQGSGMYGAVWVQ